MQMNMKRYYMASIIFKIRSEKTKLRGHRSLSNTSQAGQLHRVYAEIKFLVSPVEAVVKFIYKEYDHKKFSCLRLH